MVLRLGGSFLKTISFCFLTLLVANLSSAVAAAQDPFSVLLVDKLTHKIFLADYIQDQLQIKKEFHVTVGKVVGDKEYEGDLKTPEGIYFFTARLRPPAIKKKFGAMALMMNYPNPIDTLRGHTGTNIMLHATDDPSRLQRDYDSEGCVVVDNHEIEEISPFVQLALTPIIIYPELKKDYLNAQSKPEVRQAFEKWLTAWKSKDIDNYIGAYDEKFSYNGMNLKRYKEYKNALNAKYSEIDLRATNVRYFYHPKYDAVYFTQHYESRLKNGGQGFKSSGTKVVYFVKDGDRYKIANESFSNLKEN